MVKEFIEILTGRTHFPCKISKSEGLILKKIFEKDALFDEESLNRKKVNELQFRYIYCEDMTSYVLLEEYLFKDGESFILLENSIGVNFYLNKI